MNRGMFTGSKIHRVWKCAASAILPQSTSEDRDAASEPMRDHGKQVHGYLETVGRDGHDVAIARVKDPTARAICVAIDLAKVPVHLSTEVAFAWSWKNRVGRELGRNLGHRDYASLPDPPDPESEIPLTVDVAGLAEGAGGAKRGFVGDHKTGHSRYPRPDRFAQTLIAASCVRSTWGADDVIAELNYIDDAGEAYPARELIDGWALDDWEDSLAARMESLPVLEREYLATGKIAGNEGPHCTYCASFKHCDAKTALVRAVPQELLQIGIRPKDGGIELTPGSITRATAAAAYEAAERIVAIMNAIKDEVCGLAWHEPIELSDGRVIERRRSERRQVDGRIGVAILERLYGRDAAMEAIKVKLPISAIRELVVANIKKGQKIETRKGDGELDKILAEVQKAGGLTVAESEDCKPYQPRKRKG